jgi:hypothetical protein
LSDGEFSVVEFYEDDTHAYAADHGGVAITELDDADHFDALVEIVDALCDTLSKDQTIHKDTRNAIGSIAARARKLYRKRVDDE